ncbi:hypothetical protein OHA27_20340 [Streptomyces sp. NBC_01619]|uniref:hypothetical protein n=1 Tax=Streptomyces sp. NBC_01619 TaxID=2975901 RepID=UPI002256DE08|nr:hypothetical protein [Streptomyces sp. NBC_01619]MCX4512605.1 hypothetical protein [Streptomyces sp. NBC_01619]
MSNSTAARAPAPSMRGFAPLPYASTEIGRAAVPEPVGASTPVQLVPRRSSSRSPGLYVREALARLRQGLPALVPEDVSLPLRQST